MKACARLAWVLHQSPVLGDHTPSLDDPQSCALGSPQPHGPSGIPSTIRVGVLADGDAVFMGEAEGAGGAFGTHLQHGIKLLVGVEGGQAGGEDGEEEHVSIAVGRPSILYIV